MSKLKELLFKKGIKQVDLVKACGADPSRISMHINGVRRLPEKYISILGKHFGISNDDLIGPFENTKSNKGVK